jgi:sialate O-acetylesterase
MRRPLLLLAAAASLAAVEIAPIFNDHLVLQRDMPVPVWGTGSPDEAVTVRFAGQEKKATAGKDGRWLVRLDPLAGSKEPRELTVAGSSTITVKDILVGEVWLCSGQSNMSVTVQECLDFAAEKAAANQPLIRQIKVWSPARLSPGSSVGKGAYGTWTVATPKTVGGFTGVGYFFAREVSKALDLPVGLISSNVPGTAIEGWISPNGFRLEAELKPLADKVDAAVLAQTKLEPEPDPLPKGVKAPDPNRPTVLWNAMIHPLLPYGLRGVLWYQGENNAGDALYVAKQKALIGGWRTAFGQGDFPFYLVQLANHRSSDPAKPEGGHSWARTREAQRQLLALVPNTGMAVAIDLGESENIHPKNKQDVGHRLALWALAKDYGKGGVFSGPLYKSHAIEGSAIRVRFDHIGGGLMVGSKQGLSPVEELKDGRMGWWAVAGEDQAWAAAEARIDSDSVVVSSPAVARPVAVRYAFVQNPEGPKLYNRAGLPASPFRTDSW